MRALAFAVPFALFTPTGMRHDDVRARSSTSHDMHLTYSRVVVNGTSIVARVRVFQDDLELALRQTSKQPELVVKATPVVDSLFASVWQRTTRITADGVSLQGRVLKSGAEGGDTDARMWWYEVQLTAPKPVRELSMHIGLFFEQFRDQRNIVSVIRMPDGARTSLYFAAGDTKDVVVKW